MALQDKLDAFKADFEAGRFPLKPSKEALDTMHRATAELIASGLADAFGIRFALPADLVSLYKSFKNDLPTFNDNPAWVLPMPARYVIGRDGIIAYAEVNPDYTQRPDPSELLPVLDRLRAGKAA